MESKKDEIKYPVPVFLNGRPVGTADRRGVVTFTDQSAVDDVVRMMESNAIGLSSKDGKGSSYKDGAIHFTTLGAAEDNKMKAAELAHNKRKGRSL